MRRGAARTTFSDCPSRFAKSGLFSGFEGSFGTLGPRGNNYPPPTLGDGENLPLPAHLTVSQLESNIRKKLSPAEADNMVLAASPKNG